LQRESDGNHLDKSVSIRKLKKGRLREAVENWDPIDLDNEDVDLIENCDLPNDSFQPTQTCQDDEPYVPLSRDQPEIAIQDDTIPTIEDGIRRSSRINRGHIKKDSAFVYK
jgi:hypothetical protein